MPLAQEILPPASSAPASGKSPHIKTHEISLKVASGSWTKWRTRDATGENWLLVSNLHVLSKYSKAKTWLSPILGVTCRTTEWKRERERERERDTEIEVKSLTQACLREIVIGFLQILDGGLWTLIRTSQHQGMKLGHPQQGNYSTESVWSRSRYLASSTIESHEMSPFLPGLGVSSRRAHRFWSPRELAVARVAGHRSARSQVNRSD